MSHFTVAVFMTDDESQNIDELLAPYDENIKAAPHVKLTKAELIQEERDRLQQSFSTLYADWQKDPKAYEAKHPNPGHLQFLKSIPERMKWTDEQIYQDAIKGMEDELNENGDLMSTYNPDSKWDWYTTGGRWKGMLVRKGEGKNAKGCDEAFVCEIDFEAMRRKAEAELQPYEKAMKDSCMKEEYMRERFPSDEEYARRVTAFSTYAVVTPDGKWHAKGSMGWWGMSSETPKEERAWDLSYYEQFIKPALNNNWYLVIVDCHI